MAKNDPANIVAGAGLLTGIFTKLNAAVVALGGEANDLHRLTKPEGDAIIRAMAEQLVNPMVATVDYDDPEHRRQLKDFLEFDDVERSMIGEDAFRIFPIRRSGRRDIKYEYVVMEKPSPERVLDEIEKRGLRVPDFAETRTFHCIFPNERKEHVVVSFCGIIEGSDVASHAAYDELELEWNFLGARANFDSDNRFLAVRD